VADRDRPDRPVIGDILPATVAAVERLDDPPDVVLFPEEEAVIARAADKRRREFTTVRYCARAALGLLGLPPSPIVPGQRGAPGWPEGVVGSMTHCAGYRAAALAHVRDIATLGIDAEVHEALPAGVLDLVSLPAERSRLRQLAADEPGVCWDRLLFSAKESVYKAWYPLTRAWLDFAEADVVLERSGEFTATLLVPAPVTGFTGRWLVRDGLMLTAIAVPAAQ
jgi:4'-phosphopantetheinyl transferase EntD